MIVMIDGMMKTGRHLAVLALLLLFVTLGTSQRAHGGTGAGMGAGVGAGMQAMQTLHDAIGTQTLGAAGARSQSLASAFFVSRKLDPTGGPPRLELLGSLIIWSLLLLSMGSIGLIGYMAATNQRKTIVPDGVLKAVRRRIDGRDFAGVLELTRSDSSFFSKVLGAGLAEASHGWRAMVHAADQKSDELVAGRLRRIEFLNVLGQVSPMIGLFGTVYGMILAFRAIVVAGGNADPVMLAGGIGTALTTTFWGLVVAIPALAGYAIVRNQVDALTAEATLAADEVIGLFKPFPQQQQQQAEQAQPYEAAPQEPSSGDEG